MTDVRVCTDNWCFRDDCQGCPPPKPPPTDWRPEPDYEAIWEARHGRPYWRHT